MIWSNTMRFSSDFLKTVAFVCVKYNDTLKPVGTAFFISHMRGPQIQVYVVTAKHVIDLVKEKYAAESVFITFNGIKIREEREIRLEDWRFHPNSATNFIDVAIGRLEYDFSIKTPSIENPYQIRCWRDSSLYGYRSSSLPHLDPPELQLGEDVIMAGLFVHYSGITKNIPIVRMGNIAAIPSEPITTKLGPMNALLLEIRSIGGLSGSPVLGRLGDMSPSIIGLIHGHFDQADKDSIDCEDAVPDSSKINAGIAIVVPSQFIRETLEPLVLADFSDEHEP